MIITFIIIQRKGRKKSWFSI